MENWQDATENTELRTFQKFKVKEMEEQVQVIEWKERQKCEIQRDLKLEKQCQIEVSL